MPTRPQQFHPIPASVRRAQSRQYEQQRGSSTQRGYDYRWQKASKLYLKSHPYCVHCEARGHIERGSKSNPLCVDHVIPHRGDYALFWDQDNWQSLCKYHHDRKTVQEDGGFGRHAYRGKGHLACTIVCGPPGSGKSTYVREHMHCGDLVVDLDELFQAICFQPVYTKPLPLLPYVLQLRDTLVNRLATDPTRPQSWVITQGPKMDERDQLAKRLKAQVIVLEVSPNECLRRIGADPRRKASVALWEPLVCRWWEAYEPGDAAVLVDARGRDGATAGGGGGKIVAAPPG